MSENDAVIRATKEARAILRVIARELFVDFMDEHHKMHINSPSTRVALDHLIFTKLMTGKDGKFKKYYKQNLYCRMIQLTKERKKNVMEQKG